MAPGFKKVLNEITPEKRREIEGLRATVYGDSPMGYTTQFRQGYKNLNQPNAPENIIIGGTKSLTDNYIERVFQKTGQLPSESQVRDFVSGTLTPTFAMDFIQGINNDQIKNKYIDPHMTANMDQYQPDTSVNDRLEQEAARSRESDLQGKLNTLYGTAETGLTAKINDIYNKQREQAIEEESAMGNRGNSPISTPGLSRIDTARGQTLAETMGNLAGTRASAQLDMSKTIEGILEADRRAKETGERFGQNLAFERGKFSDLFKNEQDVQGYNRGMAERGLTMADELGRLQAKAKEPSTYDWINTGLNAVNTLANVKKSFWG